MAMTSGSSGGGHYIPPAVTDIAGFRRLGVKPRFLADVGTCHRDWPFGAIAQLVDNAMDAKATRVDIQLERLLFKAGNEKRYVSSFVIIDNGAGISYENLVRMTTCGSCISAVKDANNLGIFGLGFLSGSMGIGKNALVLTQTQTSRSILFLSQSFNVDHQYLVIPIITYTRVEGDHLLNLDAQSEKIERECYKIIEDFSPFGKLLIGEKISKFGSIGGTGTQIYIWDPEEIEAHSVLESVDRDIVIRGGGVRWREGVRGSEVKMDHSLRSYLEIFFRHECMEIYVQKVKVNWLDLKNELTDVRDMQSNIANTHVTLSLGRSAKETKNRNRGIYMYWHGRLIEAFKRFGSLAYERPEWQGIIGIMNMTRIPDAADDTFWLDRSKQGFADGDAYDALERWLRSEVDKYWAKRVDKIRVEAEYTGQTRFYWVKCELCAKWRKLDSAPILDEQKKWFCYFDQYRGNCSTFEEKMSSDEHVISTSATD